MSYRVLDPAAVEEPRYPPTFLLKSRFEPSRARREIRALFRDYLIRAQFFTAFLLLLACSATRAAAAYSGLPPEAVVLPLFPAIAGIIGLLIVAAFCLSVIESATERVLDVIAQIPAETIEQRFLRLLTDRAAEPKSFAVAAPPAHASDAGLERVMSLLRDMMDSLQTSTNRLAANAELLQSAMHAVPHPVSSGEAAHPDENAARELRIALAQLTQTIERLAVLRERMPIEAGAAPGEGAPLRGSGFEPLRAADGKRSWSGSPRIVERV